MRKSKLTLELQEKIIKFLELGISVMDTCSLVSIHKSTYYQWLERGRKAKSGKFSDFSDAIKKAEIKAKADHIENIRKAAAKGKWQASAWWLERKYPDEFGRNEKHYSGQVVGQMKMELSLDDRVREYEKRFRSAKSRLDSSDGA